MARQHSVYFSDAREYDDGVVREVRPQAADSAGLDGRPMGYDSGLWREQCRVWLDLPQHPNLIEPVVYDYVREVLSVRYFTIDPDQTPYDERSEVPPIGLAPWGAHITQLFSVLSRNVPGTRRADLCRPVAELDLGGEPRLGFVPTLPHALDTPPELVAGERCDERTLVFVVGQIVRQLAPRASVKEPTEIAEIIGRCLAADPRERYRSLRQLAKAFEEAGGPHPWRARAQAESWLRAEEATGWLSLGMDERARVCLVEAKLLDPFSALVKSGLDRLLQKSKPREPTKNWPDVEARGAQLEAERDFFAAHALYLDARLDGEHDTAIHCARARCQLAIGEGQLARDHALRALEREPNDVEALAIATRGALLARQPAEALRYAERWIAAHPLDADAAYAAGRALFALRRFVEARDAFSRATELRPEMLEAMLLRRESERAMRRVRDKVGTQPALVIDVPSHLSTLREPLAAGRIHDVLVELEKPEHASDPAARLLHARCLAAEQRFENAIAMFARTTALAANDRDLAHAAALGAAYALLALDRAADALAAFDVALAQRPGDLEALEGRAVSLRLLGRDEEADHEERRALAASAARSDARERARSGA